MNLNYYGWIDSKGKPSTMVVFKRKDDRCYISDGRIVARKNDFQRSTTVILYFQGVDNRFAMYPAIYEVGSSVLKPPPSTPVPSWSVHPISYFKTVISPQEDKIQICPIFLYNYESIIDFNSPALITDRNNKSVSVTFKNKTGSCKPNSTVNRVADKRPIILSDKDDSDEDDEENIHQFDVKVTHSLAYNDQVLRHLNPDDVLRCTIEDPPQYLNVQVIRAAAAR
ncbi:hypothetical protein TSUD_382440 [Trifolium subterraneum]|uniref:Uncharacterized protein n=1 Tax=Trifolium subterraneum TaxID=3900 RepID=A0A2Z6NDE9_TRISU|nr:hypothetical protein TSUD_382440 [Trifolium subterraneum]